ncbi:MAG TPA: HD domain-containing phosphohydrolase [Myxococcaceae bacterium]|jgi:HD-GYP domain-containing protein (c-di-GMP phosphodiesterase class II)/CheY-like chemotaxis protein
MAKKLGERLVEAGLVTKEAVDQALQQQKITGHKLGDCLVELGLLAEMALLRFLATELNTRFVTTEKLAKAKVSQEVLDKVPVRMAESQLFMPIAIDMERKILSIVAAEPQNSAMIDELALVTGMDEVYAFIGLRSAITAAIKKHYYGDVSAFNTLEAGVSGAHARPDLAGAGMDASGTRTGSGSRNGAVALRFETDVRGRSQIGSAVGAPSGLKNLMGATRGTVADNDFVETLNILVGMLEGSRKEMRGHSSQVARQAALVARRMGYSPREVSNLAIAAYLHDLGKPTNRHFTLANNAANHEWKKEAARLVRAPLRLFDTVRLPPAVVQILSQLYEAYDGTGVPGGYTGEDIHFGARILAAVDSSLDLMKNSANALGAVLHREEALKHLNDMSGSLYDPMVVDVVGQIHSGDLLRQRLQVDGRQLMVADPEEAVRTDLMDALGKRGLVAQAVGSIDGAIDACLAGEVDLLVMGLRFGMPDVCGLIDLVRKQPANAAMPVIVIGEPQDSMGKERLSQAGPSAVIPMPLDPEQAATTIQGIYRDRIINGGPGRVVRGSFDEIGPLALMQLLGRSKKSGRVSFRADQTEGFLHFEKGKLVFATFNGELGEGALRTLAKTEMAEFGYDPEALLLEMPQLDADAEALVGNLQRD